MRKRPSEKLMRRIAKRFKELRGDQSQLEFSKKIGISQSSLNRIENREQNISLYVMEQVASRLKIDIKDLNVEFEIQKDMPTVVCDHIKMNEVFFNLVNNAIKFSMHAQNPHIKMAYNSKNDMHEFSIQDNGIGIKPEFHSRVFKIFKQLNKKNEYEGTGAGLSIVKRIIDDHKGSIWIDSEEGQGATFYFTIPNNLKTPKN